MPAEIHGAQEGRRWQGHYYYGRHCWLPLYVESGRHTASVVPRVGNAGPMEGAVGVLERVVSRTGERWPDTLR